MQLIPLIIVFITSFLVGAIIVRGNFWKDTIPRDVTPVLQSRRHAYSNRGVIKIFLTSFNGIAP